MGQTQHTVGTANVRASCIALLLTGNVGKPGTGANIFRGHDNVQGATDVGLDIVTLPFYYGLAEGAWKHWARVWEVDYDYLQSRFDSKKIMETPGIPLTRWFDAVAAAEGSGRAEGQCAGDVRAGPCQQQHHPHSGIAEGAGASSICWWSPIRIRPPGRRWRSRPAARTTCICCRSATQFECKGSRVASNRSLQWGEQIVKPIFESKDDLEVMYLMAKKLGFADKMFKNIKVENNLPVAEDILREMNRGSWSTGYCGQSPERLKVHMANQKDFDMLTHAGDRRVPPRATITACRGRAGARPRSSIRARRCSTTPTSASWTAAAPSAPASASSARRRADGTPQGQPAGRRLLFARARRSRTAIPSSPTACSRSSAGTRISRRTSLRSSRRSAATTPDAVSWSTDLSGGIQRVAMKHGCVPYGNAKARMNAFGLPDPIPVHREPIYYAARRSGREISDAARRQAVPAAEYRLLGAEGGGGQGHRQAVPADPLAPAGWSNTKAAARRPAPTSGSPSCSRTCSSRSIRPTRPTRHQGRRLGLGDRRRERLQGQGEGAGHRTRRQGRRLDAVPLRRLVRRRRPAAPTIRRAPIPIVLGESANTITTYGYDPATGMQEPKVTLCQIRAA